MHDLALSLALATGAFAVLHAATLLSLVASALVESVPVRMPLAVELQRTVPDQPVQVFLSLLLRLPPVAHVAYVTKEQRYEEQRRLSPEDLPFLDRYIRENPLADTALVTLRSPGDADAVLAFLKRPVFQSVLDPTFLWSVETWRRLLAEDVLRWRVTYLLGIVLGALGMFLTLGAAFAATSLRLAREEGRLSAVVRAGAEPFRCSLPFLTENIALLSTAAALSALLLFGGGTLLWSSFPELAMVVPSMALPAMLPWLLFVSSIAVILGAGGIVLLLPSCSSGTPSR